MYKDSNDSLVVLLSNGAFHFFLSLLTIELSAKIVALTPPKQSGKHIPLERERERQRRGSCGQPSLLSLLLLFVVVVYLAKPGHPPPPPRVSVVAIVNRSNSSVWPSAIVLYYIFGLGSEKFVHF